MNRTLVVFIAVVAAIALAGGGFIAGMSVGTANAAAARPSAATGSGTQGRQGAGQVGGAQGRPLNGQVLGVGDGTLTINLGQEQGSRIVLVAPSTRVVRTTETDIPLSGIKEGERVTVVGAENSDGTVNAQAIVVGGNALQQLGSPRPSASPTR